MAKLELSQQKLNTVKKAEEYYNALRTNVQLSGNNLKVIAVTSVDPSEGKSTTSTNIAWAFARAGYKTLLIDADIRNSVMSGVFKSRERITGLTDYLAGTQDFVKMGFVRQMLTICLSSSQEWLLLIQQLFFKVITLKL